MFVFQECVKSASAEMGIWLGSVPQEGTRALTEPLCVGALTRHALLVRLPWSVVRTLCTKSTDDLPMYLAANESHKARRS